MSADALPSPAVIAHFERLGFRLRANRNRRTLVSLRDQRRGPPVLSVHADLFADPLAMADIERFAREGGGGRYPHMQLAMQAIVRDAPGKDPDQLAAANALERIGRGFDFEACFRRVHARYFGHLPRPFFRWGQSAGNRRLRSLRFGSYIARPHPAIRLHPRLDQPWVALIFIEHVIHHELAHHQQACDPRPGERQHSPRFRAIERTYPHFDAAMAWEAVNIQRFLVPPDEALLMGDPGSQ